MLACFLLVFLGAIAGYLLAVFGWNRGREHYRREFADELAASRQWIDCEVRRSVRSALSRVLEAVPSWGQGDDVEWPENGQ